VLLVDSSVCFDHLREGVPALADRLEQEWVLVHPMVLLTRAEDPGVYPDDKDESCLPFPH
jgi:hypothetical protein